MRFFADVAVVWVANSSCITPVKRFSPWETLQVKPTLVLRLMYFKRFAMVCFWVPEGIPSPEGMAGMTVTESTITATLHCPDVGYCLFGISLVTHISYHVPYTFPIVIVSYWVVLSFARLFTPLAFCTQLGYSTLPTMYYWISTSVAIPCLFDSITCFVSYILSPVDLCFRT